jgi:alpha-beta hydrolase superfamily lysophospholipase
MQAKCVIAGIQHIPECSNSNIGGGNDIQMREDQYILMGHSSGANICGLALNQMAENRFANCHIDYFIGLSGVYDIGQHYLWERDRGVHEIRYYTHTQ